MSEQENSLSWDSVGTAGWHGFKRQPKKFIAETHMGRIVTTRMLILGQAVPESQIARDWTKVVHK